MSNLFLVMLRILLLFPRHLLPPTLHIIQVIAGCLLLFRHFTRGTHHLQINNYTLTPKILLKHHLPIQPHPCAALRTPVPSVTLVPPMANVEWAKGYLQVLCSIRRRMTTLLVHPRQSIGPSMKPLPGIPSRSQRIRLIDP